MIRDDRASRLAFRSPRALCILTGIAILVLLGCEAGVESPGAPTPSASSP